MASKENKDSKESNVTFTTRDFELLAGAMKSMKFELVVDYAKFAERCGLKNANSAKASWHGIKKKLDKMDAAGSAEPSMTITTAEATETKAGGKKKRKAAEESEGEEEGEAKAKGKAAKKAGGKKKAKAVEESEGEEEAEAKGAKKPVTKRGRKARKTPAAATLPEEDEDAEETPAEKLVDAVEGEEGGEEDEDEQTSDHE